jgi:hypothetical protein
VSGPLIHRGARREFRGDVLPDGDHGGRVHFDPEELEGEAPDPSADVDDDLEDE